MFCFTNFKFSNFSQPGGFYATSNYSRLPLRENDSMLFIQKGELIAQPAMRLNLRKIEMSLFTHVIATYIVICMLIITISRCHGKVITILSMLNFTIFSFRATFRLYWRCYPFIGAIGYIKTQTLIDLCPFSRNTKRL